MKFRFAALAVVAASAHRLNSNASPKHHKKHHKKHHHKSKDAKVDAKNDVPKAATNLAVSEVKQEPAEAAPAPAEAAPAEAAPAEALPEAGSGVPGTEDKIVDNMKAMEGELETNESHNVANHVMMTSKLDINGPLPADFNALFAQSVSKATEVKGLSCPANEIKVLETNVIQAFLQTQTKNNVIVEIVFQGPAPCVYEATQQAANADSPLVGDTPMFAFLVAKGESVDEMSQPPKKDDVGVDIDTQMPYGELEPFGREDTAQELTEDSIKESDTMVDQIERAQVAEEKRSVFRALTRLRGAAITSFDGVARSQTGNIDEYNKTHKWRKTHPLHHLAAEESDVTKWAFPATAD